MSDNQGRGPKTDEARIERNNARPKENSGGGSGKIGKGGIGRDEGVKKKVEDILRK